MFLISPALFWNPKIEMKIKLRKNALLEPARVFMRGHVLSSCHLRETVDNNNLAYLKHAEMIKLHSSKENS